MKKCANNKVVVSEEDKKIFKFQLNVIFTEASSQNIILKSDHCYAGKFGESAEEGCNLRFGLSNMIPVAFHNLKGYDSD